MYRFHSLQFNLMPSCQPMFSAPTTLQSSAHPWPRWRCRRAAAPRQAWWPAAAPAAAWAPRLQSMDGGAAAQGHMSRWAGQAAVGSAPAGGSGGGGGGGSGSHTSAPRLAAPVVASPAAAAQTTGLRRAGRAGRAGAAACRGEGLGRRGGVQPVALVATCAMRVSQGRWAAPPAAGLCPPARSTARCTGRPLSLIRVPRDPAQPAREERRGVGVSMGSRECSGCSNACSARPLLLSPSELAPLCSQGPLQHRCTPQPFTGLPAALLPPLRRQGAANPANSTGA